MTTGDQVGVSGPMSYPDDAAWIAAAGAPRPAEDVAPELSHHSPVDVTLPPDGDADSVEASVGPEIEQEVAQQPAAVTG
jgi:hypothetical protein